MQTFNRSTVFALGALALACAASLQPALADTRYTMKYVGPFLSPSNWGPNAGCICNNGAYYGTYNAGNGDRAFYFDYSGRHDLYYTTNTSNFAYGCSDSGIIAGSRNGQPVLWEVNQPDIIRLPVPFNNFSEALAVNNTRQAVGYRQDNGPTGDGPARHHAVLWTYHPGTRSPQQMIDLGDGLATSINNAGAVVGSNGQAFLWQNGVRRSIFSRTSSANRILDNGNVVGAVDMGTGHSFAYCWNPNYQFTIRGGDVPAAILNPLSGSTDSVAYSINRRGQVVGTSSAGLADRACIWENRTPGRIVDPLGQVQAYDLNVDAGQSPGTLRQALDINDYGVILCIDGYHDAYLLIPR